MNKPNIKKLKYPFWFKIIFYILTIIVPIVLLMVEGLTSPSRTFRISFGVLCILLIGWTFIKKFILKDIETKLQTHKMALEHDYEIEVGSAIKIKWLWFNNELILTILNIIEVLLLGGLLLMIAVGIQSMVLTVKGISFTIAILYMIAYIIKIITILILRGKEENSDT